MAQKTLTHLLHLLGGDGLKESIGDNIWCVLARDKAARNKEVSFFPPENEGRSTYLRTRFNASFIRPFKASQT